MNAHPDDWQSEKEYGAQLKWRHSWDNGIVDE